MEQHGYQRETCRLCDSAELEVVLPLTATPLCDAYVSAERRQRTQATYPLDLYLCRTCGFVQLAYVVDPDVIYRDYLYVTASSLGLADHFGQYADRVQQQLRLPAGSLVVDIGSNDGTLLGRFKDRGMRVLGIEPATRIAQQATSAGIETLPDFFSAELAHRIASDYGRPQLITINNLFANIDNLVDLAAEIAELLASGGYLVIESSYLGDMIDNMVFDFIYHEHLSYLSVKPLMIFFRRFGLELVDIDRVDTKGGSLRYYFRKGDAGASVRVGEMATAEERRGLYRPEIYRDFARRIDGVRQALLDALAEQKAQGQMIIGYGGSATTTTLIYHLGLTGEIEYIVDDNQAKHHTYSPGCHIPVLPSDVLYERPSGCVVVLAWRYWRAIVDKHRRYLDRGGLFVVPLPKLRLVGR